MSIEDAADFHYWRASKLSGDGHAAEALYELEIVFEINPCHILGLILAGELYVLYPEELGVDANVACDLALGYFDKALAHEPDNPDPWAGKSLALLYLDRFEDSIAAAEKGLSFLSSVIGHGVSDEAVHKNIAESLFSNKVKALLSLGRKEEARQALIAGFDYCPGSNFLSKLVDEFWPLC